jgi:hypothetical protein
MMHHDLRTMTSTMTSLAAIGGQSYAKAWLRPA